jgi:hypothetical protein
VRGIGWPDTPRVRLSAIAGALSGNQFATLLTAAWVWGAAEDPGDPLSVAGFAGRARTQHTREVHRYELRISEAEVARLGQFGVTTPLRTILDLLHLSPTFGEIEQHSCRELLSIAQISTEELSQLLITLRRPHIRLARERWREISLEHRVA